jgi:hypothetical protein
MVASCPRLTRARNNSRRRFRVDHHCSRCAPDRGSYSDNSLFSNQLTINVAAPPTPNYTYIGIISPQNRVTDTALVQDRSNRNVVSAYRGDVIGGRFRVTSISEKELVVVTRA